MSNELLRLENDYWEGMASHDYESVKALTKFPCIVAGKQGVMAVDEPSYKKMFEQGGGKNIKVNSITNEQVQTGEDHAMIAYLIELDYDGKLMHCACTSTWVKEGGQWRCAMHTECDLQEKSSK